MQVMTKILIGVDGSGRSEGCRRLRRALALASGAPVILAMAHRAEPLRPGAGAHEVVLREDAGRTLARLAGALDDIHNIELQPLVKNTSAAHALQELAEQEDAGIIVVGSSHTGRLGRVLPGSTAERLLHGAPSRCRRAARLPNARDVGASGGRLRLPADKGPRRARRRGGARLALSGSLRVMQAIEPLERL